ncbi:MAG: RecX family transcriptional regulator [Novosphingobium sp.]
MPQFSPKRVPKPLDPRRLEELALAYVARFATSAGKLEDYLRRKLRERGWDDAEAPALAPLVERLVAAGYVDDRAFAIAKAGGLLRRGYGGRRIDQALGAAGIGKSLREEAGGTTIEQRQAALALARRRGFGPFGTGVGDRALREKQIAKMLRAGHPLDSVRQIVNAHDVSALEEWAALDEGA